MCGLVGIWNRDGRPIDLDTLQSATSRLAHRGPDDEGYLLVNTRTGTCIVCGAADTAPSLGLPDIRAIEQHDCDLAFGFRRLSILDLTANGHQPMSDATGRYWIVLNGEIYNYLELRAELVGLGYAFTSETDTEVVLAAFAQWGQRCLEKFNGMWAFAIWDNTDRSLFLARDRFGIKPLYLVSSGDMLAFASEQKALLAVPGVSAAPAESAIYSFLAYGTLPVPTERETFLAGIESIPPATVTTITQHARKQQPFWQLELAPHQPVEHPPVDELAALFEDAVRIRLRSDVPVGSCLSGGLDSSSIVSTISSLLGPDRRDQQHTFSSVYDESAPYNERPFIEEMAAFSGVISHHTTPDTTRLVTDFEHMVWHQDEPFANASIFAQWCVMDLARRHNVTVLLDGQGADELLAGYRPFTIHVGEMFADSGIHAAVRESRKIAAINGTLWYRLLLVALLRRQRFMRGWARSSFAPMSSSNRRALQPDFRDRAKTDDTIDREIAAVRDMDAYSQHALFKTLPHLLRYEDRSSMAFSIEARTPFLDYRLVTFIFQIAARWRIHDGWSKWILRQAQADRLPSSIAWRRDKVGYGTPEMDLTYALAQDRLPHFEQGTHIARFLNIDHVRTHLQQRPSTLAGARLRWRWLVLEAWLSHTHRRYAPA